MSTQQRLCTVLRGKIFHICRRDQGECNTGLQFTLATPFSIKLPPWRVWYNLILLRCGFPALWGSTLGPWDGREGGCRISITTSVSAQKLCQLFPPRTSPACEIGAPSTSGLVYPSLANWALHPTEFSQKCSFLTFMRLSFLIDPECKPL